MKNTTTAQARLMAAGSTPDQIKSALRLGINLGILTPDEITIHKIALELLGSD